MSICERILPRARKAIGFCACVLLILPLGISEEHPQKQSETGNGVAAYVEPQWVQGARTEINAKWRDALKKGSKGGRSVQPTEVLDHLYSTGLALLKEQEVDWKLMRRLAETLARSQPHKDALPFTQELLAKPFPPVVSSDQFIAIANAMSSLGLQRHDEEVIAFFLRYIEAESWGDKPFTFDESSSGGYYENTPIVCRSRFQTLALQAIANMGPEIALPILKQIEPGSDPSLPFPKNLRLNIENLEAKQRGEHIVEAMP